MPTLVWIIGSGLLMSALAFVGSVTLLFSEAALRRLISPLVAFVAGIALLFILKITLESE